MGSLYDYCPWCGRRDGLYDLDAIGYPICTSAKSSIRTGAKKRSCLHYHALELGVNTVQEYTEAALCRRFQHRPPFHRVSQEAWTIISSFVAKDPLARNYKGSGRGKQ